MRTVAVSDTHGKDLKSCYDSIVYTYGDKFDNIVFLGDYLDNRCIDNELQIKRLMDLFDIQACDERVHILIGNHDAHYLNYDPNDKYSYKLDNDQALKVKKILEDNLTNIEYSFWDGKYLYIHEGITNEFINAVGIKQGFQSPMEVCSHLNKMLQVKMLDELFKAQDGLQYRYCVCKNPESYNQFEKLKSDKYPHDQVVGHYDKMGMQVVNGIYMIENTYHGNYVLFES